MNIANPTMVAGWPPMYDPATPTGAAALDEEVTRQAGFVASINDGHIMMIALPFLLPMRRNRTR